MGLGEENRALRCGSVAERLPSRLVYVHDTQSRRDPHANAYGGILCVRARHLGSARTGAGIREHSALSLW